jgi:hypothetical protein
MEADQSPQETLKDVNLVKELVHTLVDVEKQLIEDEKRWGDEWKKRGLVWKGQSQEERFYGKILEYITDWRDLGVPVPWLKIIGEAHIALVREKKLKNSE